MMTKKMWRRRGRDRNGRMLRRERPRLSQRSFIIHQTPACTPSKPLLFSSHYTFLLFFILYVKASFMLSCIPPLSSYLSSSLQSLYAFGWAHDVLPRKMHDIMLFIGHASSERVPPPFTASQQWFLLKNTKYITRDFCQFSQCWCPLAYWIVLF